MPIAQSQSDVSVPQISPHSSIDPLVLEASDDVDRSLLAWSLAMSPRERLRACTRATRALSKFKRVSASKNR